MHTILHSVSSLLSCELGIAVHMVLDEYVGCLPVPLLVRGSVVQCMQRSAVYYTVLYLEQCGGPVQSSASGILGRWAAPADRTSSPRSSG